jgi:hypothetical protein
MPGGHTKTMKIGFPRPRVFAAWERLGVREIGQVFLKEVFLKESS